MTVGAANGFTISKSNVRESAPERRGREERRLRNARRRFVVRFADGRFQI
jgi:hypothetical protein